LAGSLPAAEEKVAQDISALACVLPGLRGAKRIFFPPAASLLQLLATAQTYDITADENRKPEGLLRRARTT
jgi:hypothetical protein